MALNTGFMDFLEERPEIAFYSHLQDRGYGPAKQRRYKSIMGDLHNTFLGRLGSQIRRGELPTLRWNTFLEDTDFRDHFHSRSPLSRGQFSRRFAPPTRHIYRT